MAGSIAEDYLSRPFTVGRQKGRELIFHIIGTEDETEAESLLDGAAPAVYLGLVRETINADPEGAGKWKGYARYVRQEDDPEYTFDTGGGTVRLTQSLSTIASYAPAGFAAPNFQGAIGVNADKVEGVDVPAPAYQFTETHYMVDSAVDTAYKLTLFNLTGRFNDATFKGFAAGEVRFLGASGSKRGDELWTITYRFECSPNAIGLTVGTITGIAKLGWDYLWVRYADFSDATGYATVQRPVAAYVERTSLPGDFSALSIGT